MPWRAVEEVRGQLILLVAVLRSVLFLNKIEVFLVQACELSDVLALISASKWVGQCLHLNRWQNLSVVFVNSCSNHPLIFSSKRVVHKLLFLSLRDIGPIEVSLVGLRDQKDVVVDLKIVGRPLISVGAYHLVAQLVAWEVGDLVEQRHLYEILSVADSPYRIFLLSKAVR